MRTLIVSFSAALMLVSCSTFHVTTEIDHGSKVEKLKKSGIIIRLPNSSPIAMTRFAESMGQWLAGYKRVNTLPIVSASPSVSEAATDFDQFLQFTARDEFMTQKTVGIITVYLEKNRAELEKLMADNDLDSMIIYEINGAFSAEMQFYDFRSLVAVVDKAFMIQYLDHHFDRYDANNPDPTVIQNHLLDRVNERLIDYLKKMDFIKAKR